ncbi:MAG: SLC13 family permease, partial [Kosmotogaceae bacterium]
NFDDVSTEIDWNAILFFIGLFALAHSLESSGIAGDLSNIILKLSDNPIMLSTAILWISGTVAMVTGAIPVVTIFIPIVAKLSAHYPLSYDLWIALALGANLGGNGTLTGHLANIMCFEIVNKETRKKNTFLDFFKLGLPVAIVALVISNAYLFMRLVIFA